MRIKHYALFPSPSLRMGLGSPPYMVYTRTLRSLSPKTSGLGLMVPLEARSLKDDSASTTCYTPSSNSPCPRTDLYLAVLVVFAALTLLLLSSF